MINVLGTQRRKQLINLKGENSWQKGNAKKSHRKYATPTGFWWTEEEFARVDREGMSIPGKINNRSKGMEM